jgi:hypothetical protein
MSDGLPVGDYQIAAIETRLLTIGRADRLAL